MSDTPQDATPKPAGSPDNPAGKPGGPKGKQGVDSSVTVMGGLTLALVVWAFIKGPDVPLKGLQASLELLQGVWIPLLLGFCLAGFFNVLVPHKLLVKWMGEQSGFQGILIGWLIGLLMPGGPYVVFPIAASLLKQGVAVGPLLAFITAKSLLSPTRLFTWEVPFLGWPFVAARAIPSLLFPPIIGVIGQRLFHLFSK
jgi:uncharacterized membrane protein YraQ (UPF0718 family)